MKNIFLLFFLTLALHAQTAVTGLGGSTCNCSDRDGDGYGTGPAVLLNTTTSTTIGVGTQTVTPASMTIGTTTATTYNNTGTGVAVTSGGLVTKTGGAAFISNSVNTVGTYIVIPGAGCATVATVANACTVASVSGASTLQLAAGSYTVTGGQTATWASPYVHFTSIASMEPGEAISGSVSGVLAASTQVIGSATNSGLGNTINDIQLSPAPLLPFSGLTVTLSIGPNMRLRIFTLDGSGTPQWPGNMETVQVSATTSTTFTATFFFSHTGTIHITDLRCLGADADDLDATVHSAAQGIAKYSTLTAFIKALYTPARGYTTAIHADYAAYSPAHYWCLSPTGVDGSVASSTTAEAACTSPYLTWAHIAGSVAANDMVILRSGFNDRITPPSGTSGHPTIIIGYPGEWPAFDAVASAGAGIYINPAHDVVVDGVRFQNGGTLALGDSSYFLTAHDFHDIIIRHVDAGAGIFTGNQSCWTAQEAGFTNFIVEDNSCHDSAEHGMYLGCTFVPCTGLKIQRNVFANNGWSGFGGAALHVNGLVPGAVISQNYAIGSTIDAFDLQSGFSGGTVTSNIAVSTNPSNDTIALALVNYKDGSDCDGGVNTIGDAPCQVSNTTWSSGTATLTFSNPGTGIDFFVGSYVFVFGISPSGYNCTGVVGCQITAVNHSTNTISYAVASNPGTYMSGGVAGMGVGDATGNLIENNTFISAYAGFAAVRVVNSCQGNPVYCPLGTGTNVVAGTMNNQTFRNNIFIANGAAVQGGADNANFPHMPVVFDNTMDASSSFFGANYLPTATFDHNLFFDLNDPAAAHSWAIGQANTCGGTPSGYVSYSVAGVHQQTGCADLSFTTGGLTGNLWGDPRLVSPQSAMLSSYVFSEAFDMRLLNTSPAFGAGSATSLPQYDALGRAYIGGGTPSMGGIERNLYKYGWNDLGVGLYNTADGASAGRTASCPLNGAPGSASCGDGVTTCGGLPGYPGNASILYPFQSLCAAELGDYSGGINRDQPQHEALIWLGGGHGDYPGNEVNAINYDLLTPTITTLVHASYTPGDTSSLTIYDPDGNPDTRHTFNQLVYIPPSAGGEKDTMWMHNGGMYGGANANYLDVWSFNLGSNSWVQSTTCAAATGSPKCISPGTAPANAGHSPTGAFEYDPNSGLVFGFVEQYVFEVWNPATEAIAGIPGSPGTITLSGSTSSIDTLRKNFWSVGYSYSGSFTFPIAMYPIPNIPSSMGTPAYFYSGTNPGFGNPVHSSADAWAQSLSAGITYMQTHDAFAMVSGPAPTVTGGPPGNTVYLVNPDPAASSPLVSTALSVPGTAPVVSGCTSAAFHAVQGIYGHFRYSQSMDLLAYVPCYGTDAAVLSLEPSDPSVSVSSSPTASVTGAVTVTGGVSIK